MLNITSRIELKRKSALISLLILSITCLQAYSQNAHIDSLLVKISSLQQKKSDFYRPGHFPSQRIHLKKKNYCREDDNIFFTGLIVWTLQTYESKLSLKNHKLVDSICGEAIKNYPLYKNKDGGVTYNFWQTSPSKHFPNDSYFSKRKKYILPDDLDDTSILYLSNIHSDSSKNALKSKMEEHANRQTKTIHNTFKEFKHISAYSTWFGENMPVDFDICVHANALKFVLDNKLHIEGTDIETAHLIVDMVNKNYHIRYPHLISPHYQSSVVVLYHLARLISSHHSFGLERIKSKVINDLQEQMRIAVHPLNKLLLTNSLMKLGVQTDNVTSVRQNDFEHFYFFVANMSSTFPNPFKRWFAKNKQTNFYYRSEAYYWALVYENACLSL